MPSYPGKRLLDLALTLPALVALAPVVAATAAAVLFKFRTMTDARDAKGELLPDAERLPAFGRWLRATSLDELPELLNVFRSDMPSYPPNACSTSSAT
jgi:lipopolysaccharide/colanic/teichoic acid biosynthesis glycosyltransferase